MSTAIAAPGAVAEVVLARGEQASGLAVMVGTLLAQNVSRHPERLRDFRRLAADVTLDVTDVGTAVTLSFDGDRCTVHEGVVGRPRVRLTTDSATLLELGQVRIGPFGLPHFLDAPGRRVVAAVAAGRLRLRGLHHLPTLLRVTRLFSVV